VRVADFAGQPVDHDSHLVARIVDEQLLAGGVGLPHRDRQLRRPATIEIAEPAVAITFRMLSDIFVPHDLQRHMLALQLAMDRCPVRFRAAAMVGLGASRAVKRRLQNGIADIRAQRPSQTRDRCPPQRLAHRRGRGAHPIRNRLVTQPLLKPVP